MALWYQAIHPVFSGVTPPTNKRFRLGSRRTSIDGSVWVYGKGVASLAVGDWVVFQDDTFTPVRTTGTLTGYVGISASANTSATSLSWYMIYGATKNTSLNGLVNMPTDGSADKLPVYQTATAGRAGTTPAAATKAVFGAVAAGAVASNAGNAILNHPFTMGTATL